MRFNVTRIRRLLWDGALQRRGALHQSQHSLAGNVQLVPRSLPVAKSDQFEKGNWYCFYEKQIVLMFFLSTGRRSWNSLLALRQSHSRLVRMVRDETFRQCHTQPTGTFAQHWPLIVNIIPLISHSTRVVQGKEYKDNWIFARFIENFIEICQVHIPISSPSKADCLEGSVKFWS